MWEEMWENTSENPLFIYKIQYLMRWFGTSPATTAFDDDPHLPRRGPAAGSVSSRSSRNSDISMAWLPTPALV